MSNPRDDYFGSQSKSRMSRSSPGVDSQTSGLFQTGQGGRTVLPPLSSAFPTSHFPVPTTSYPIQYPQQYSQQRPPGRSDYNAPMYHNQWANNPASHQAPSYPSYEQDLRYLSQDPIPSYPSRSSPDFYGDPHGSRRSPHPIVPSQANFQDDRWQGASSYPAAPHGPVSSNFRSPNASYTMAYEPYPVHHSSSYTYPSVSDHRAIQHPVSSLDQTHMVPRSTMDRSGQPRGEARGPSPYSRNAPPVSPTGYSSQSAAATPPDESQVKKKRKRAEQWQLDVLNEVYARTAFPSTEERAELAKKLDMTPRSVQIWFQNKRQSMRQTSRQPSSSVSPTTHQGSFSMSSSSHSVPHASVSGYGNSSRTGSQSPSRRSRSQEETIDSQKWPRGY